MIDELIVKIVDSMINTDIISKDDKEAYVYAYTITLEKSIDTNYDKHNGCGFKQACEYNNIFVYIYVS